MNNVSEIMQMIKLTAAEEEIKFENLLFDIKQSESNFIEDLKKTYKTLLELNTISQILGVSVDYLLNIAVIPNKDDDNNFDNVNKVPQSNSRRYKISKPKFYWLCYNDENAALKYMLDLIQIFKEEISKHNLQDEKKQQEFKKFQENYNRFCEETDMEIFLAMREKDLEYDELVKDAYNLIQFIEREKNLKNIFYSKMEWYKQLEDDISYTEKTSCNELGSTKSDEEDDLDLEWG